MLLSILIMVRYTGYVKWLIPKDLPSINAGDVYKINVKADELVMELETGKGIMEERSPISGIFSVHVEKEQEVIYSIDVKE